MKCFDRGPTKHLAIHRKYPTFVERMKRKLDILDGVHRQLNKVYKPSETLACTATAYNEPLAIRDDENLNAISEIMEVGFFLNQSNITEYKSEDELSTEWKITFSVIRVLGTAVRNKR